MKTRKRRNFKRRVKKRRSVVHRAPKNNENTMIRIKYRGWADLVTPTNSPGASICIPLNCVGYYASVGYTSPSTTAFAKLPNLPRASLQALFGIFDIYRVNSVSVQLCTNYVNNTPSTSAQDMEMYYYYNDPDDMVTSNQTVMDNLGVDPTPVSQGVTGRRFIKHRFNQTKLGLKQWFNTAAGFTSVAPNSAVVSDSISVPTFYKSWKMFQPIPFQASPIYFGRLICDWDVSLKSLTSTT